MAPWKIFIVNGKKLCPHCGKMRAISQFCRDKDKPTGLRSWCNPCIALRTRQKYQSSALRRRKHNRIVRRRYWQNLEMERKRSEQRRRKHPRKVKSTNARARVKSRFGISLEERAAMELKQHNRCAICKKRPMIGRRLGLDHNHKTGKLRELLCIKCNAGVGDFNEDVELLKSAISYIKKHNR